MIDDDVIEPVEPVDDELGLEGEEKKKKDLIDDDTVSLEDEIEEELEDDEEPFDDITNT